MSNGEAPVFKTPEVKKDASILLKDLNAHLEDLRKTIANTNASDKASVDKVNGKFEEAKKTYRAWEAVAKSDGSFDSLNGVVVRRQFAGDVRMVAELNMQASEEFNPYALYHLWVSVAEKTIDLDSISLFKNNIGKEFERKIEERLVKFGVAFIFREAFASAIEKNATAILEQEFETIKEAIEKRVENFEEWIAKASELEKMQTLFEAVKVGGLLGIEYDYSEGRMPKTASQALQPNEKGKRTADCDELAMLYIAAFKHLGLGVENFNMLEITWNVEAQRKPEVITAYHANLLSIGETLYLIDPGFNKPPTPIEGAARENIPKEALRKALQWYYGKEFIMERKADGSEVKGKISSLQSYRKLETEQQMASIYHYQQGLYYEQEKKDLQHAVEAYGTAVKEDTANEMAVKKFKYNVVRLAESYHKRKQYTEADKIYKRATEVLPQFVDVYMNRGIVNREWGQSLKNPEEADAAFKTAIECLQKAIELEPTNVMLRQELGFVQFLSGRYEDCIKTCRKAVDDGIVSDVIHLNIGAAYVKLGAQAFEMNRSITVEENQLNDTDCYELAIGEYNKGLDISSGETRRKLLQNLENAKEELEIIRRRKNLQNQ